MAKKRKKKPPRDATEPKGKMLPAEGPAGRPDDEGTRIDDGARHAFFSFKGELKSGLPADATETDIVSKFPSADQTSTTDPAPDAASDDAAAEADDTPADETPADSEPATDTHEPAASPEPDAAADEPAEPAPETAPPESAGTPKSDETDADPVPGIRAQEQFRAGPVRGPDPAAQKTASQSRKAAGPAHFIPPSDSPLGESSAEDQAAAPSGAEAGRRQDQAAVPLEPKAEAPSPPQTADVQATAAAPAEPPAAPTAAEAPQVSEPPTHTDVRGHPFAQDDLFRADAPTHTEIDAGIFAAPPEPKEVTQTEFEPWPRPAPATPARVEAPKTPVRPPPAKPKGTSLGDESAAMGSETMLEAASRKPKDETAAGTATDVDSQGAGGTADVARAVPAAPKPGKPAGDSETLLDAAPRRVAEETAAGTETSQDQEGARGPEPVTRTEPDVRAPRYAGPDDETVTKEPAPTATGAQVTATDVAREAAAPEAPSFHDAETDPQPFGAIAQETALAPDPFEAPAPGDEPTTDPIESAAPAPAPFAGPLFDAPKPSAEVAPEEVTGPKPPRRRRYSERKRGEPALKRLVRWARQRLDPRDFLEIVGTTLFERASKLGEKVRTARRENRVAHTAGWWRQTLLELAILYAIVIPIELAVSGGRLGSFGTHPHPYWLIVLPLAAARGLVAGMLAAGIASILYTIGAAQAVNDAVFTFRNMTEPLLFFAVAFFAGEMHDEGLLKRRKLDRRVKDLEERTAQLRQQRDVLTDANRELEKRIVDDSVQFGNLIQAARRIERAGRQEVFDLALEMAEEHCGAAASVLMLLEDRSLDYLCHRGWPAEDVGRRLGVARASAFVKRAVAEGVAVNGLDPSEVAPQEGPLVVAPLFDAGGVVRAVMCLDEIPLARLNESTVTVFLGIADWASAALARLTRGGDAPAPRTAALSVGPEVDLWLGTVGDLGKRLRIELARCSRYGVATSFLTIQATEWKDATREGIDALDRFILMHFTTGLRPSDGIYRFGYPGAYLLVLAGTAREGAEVVRTRLERRISYTPSPVGAIEILATGPDAEAPDLVTLVERVAKGFRDRSRLPLDARCPVAIAERLDAEDLNAFLRRLKMETSLAVRNGFDLHVVGISAEASEKAGPGILARHVVEVGEQTLRPTDGVYMIGQYQCSIILPCTSGEEAATVAHRLATLVRSRDPSAPYGAIETQVLGLGSSHPDAGSFLTALARRGRETSR